MKIGILYLLTGVGHFREAKAIEDALKEKGLSVETLDPVEKFRHSTGLLGKLVALVFDFFVLCARPFMNWIPHFGIRKLSTESDIKLKISRCLFGFSRAMESLVGRLLGKSLDLSRYDLVLSTHPMTTGLAKGFARTKAGKDLKIVNICPDEIRKMAALFYKVNGIRTIVNSDFVKKVFESLGIETELINVFGHPLDPQILRNRGKIFNRVQESLRKGEISLGLYIGGLCPESQKKSLLEVIKELEVPIKEEKLKLNVLTGCNHNFEKRLDSLVEKLSLGGKIKLFRTKNPGEIIEVGHSWMLREINIMFSRPSELVFYSLATGIPHITFPPFGPQELDMLSLLKKYADIKEYLEIKGKIAKFLADKDCLLKMSHDLFHSDYSFDGTVNITKLLTEESALF